MVPTKRCPNCRVRNSLLSTRCAHCGRRFPSSSRDGLRVAGIVAAALVVLALLMLVREFTRFL